MARLIPKSPIRPAILPLIRVLSRVQSRLPARGVEVLTVADGVGVRLYRPEGRTAPGPGLLWIHGGGLIIGTAAQDDLLCKRYASRLGVTVVSVEYRLAPKTLIRQRSRTATPRLKWLAALPAVDAARVAIAAAAHGGGLAAALAFLARDRGEVTSSRRCWPTRCSTIAAAPVHRTTTPASGCGTGEATTSAGTPTWPTPTGRSRCRRAAPTWPVCRRAWIGVGSLDLFHDEDLAYAERVAGGRRALRNPFDPRRFPRIRRRRPEDPGGPRVLRQPVRGAATDPGGLTMTTEQRALREAVAALLEKRSPEARVRELMATDTGYDETTWQELADMGLLGLAVPEYHGGTGAGHVEMGIVMEEMGRALLCAPFFSTAVLAPALLAAAGDIGRTGRRAGTDCCGVGDRDPGLRGGHVGAHP